MRLLRDLALVAAAAAGLVLGMGAATPSARADEVVLVHDHWRHRPPPPPRWHRPPPPPPPRYYRPPPVRYYRY